MYIHQQKTWPRFTWDSSVLQALLSSITHKQGKLVGRMEGLGMLLKSEAVLETMTLEALKSNEIEGEILDIGQVRSSLARRLGIAIAGLVPSDRYVDGVVEVMLDATEDFDKPLTSERLFNWQTKLFPGTQQALHKITVGTWRTESEPMQVVSGPMGREKIHFEAPEAVNVPAEMQCFLEWFNSDTEPDPLIKAAIAHLWFLTIHPFDDGNGRLARTITDMQLARADGLSQRFYSMSAQIRIERKAYYTILETTQRGSLDITKWLEWFLICLDLAVTAAENTLAVVLYKARLWDKLAKKSINDRQRHIINLLPGNFVGKLTTSKWAKITKCSQDSAYRDIQHLIAENILEKEEASGRSTSYRLASLPNPDQGNVTLK